MIDFKTMLDLLGIAQKPKVLDEVAETQSRLQKDNRIQELALKYDSYCVTKIQSEFYLMGYEDRKEEEKEL